MPTLASEPRHPREFRRIAHGPSDPAAPEKFLEMRAKKRPHQHEKGEFYDLLGDAHRVHPPSERHAGSRHTLEEVTIEHPLLGQPFRMNEVLDLHAGNVEKLSTGSAN